VIETSPRFENQQSIRVQARRSFDSNNDARAGGTIRCGALHDQWFQPIGSFGWLLAIQYACTRNHAEK
jgi:hypothetical protein